MRQIANTEIYALTNVSNMSLGNVGGQRAPRGQKKTEPVNNNARQPRTVDTDANNFVNLSFLPDKYVKRIQEIFDGYFSLGMKPSYWQYVDEATPKFPNAVSSLTSGELGDTMGSYTAWYAFTSDKKKYVAVACNYMERELTKAQDATLGELVAEKGNIEAKKAQARNHPDYLSLLSYTQRLQGILTMLDAELDSYDKCIFTLSREINRREGNGGF